MVCGLINDKLKGRRENSRGLFDSTVSSFEWKAYSITLNSSVRLACVPALIRTQHHQICLRHHCQNSEMFLLCSAVEVVGFNLKAVSVQCNCLGAC
jgi:hypothetical protein